MKKLALIAAALSLPAAGCSVRNWINMEKVRAEPASPMVAKRIQPTLYLVLDPEKVADFMELRATGAWGAQRTITFEDFQLFVTRDLKATLENYFERVEVVKSGDPLPDGPIVIADVRVDRFKFQHRVHYHHIEMTWGLGLRPSDASEYVFSFIDESSSQFQISFERTMAQLIESAIMEFNKALAEKGFSNLKKACEVDPSNQGIAP